MRTQRIWKETYIELGDVSSLYPRLNLNKERLRVWIRRGLLKNGIRTTLDYDTAGRVYTSKEALERFIGMSNGELP